MKRRADACSPTLIGSEDGHQHLRRTAHRHHAPVLFLLYAEDQGLLPDDPVWMRAAIPSAACLSACGDDAGRHPGHHGISALARMPGCFRPFA